MKRIADVLRMPNLSLIHTPIQLLYKEWRKNVNKKRREAFAMAKTGVEKPMKIPKEEKEKEKEIPATPPSPPKEEVVRV